MAESLGVFVEIIFGEQLKKFLNSRNLSDFRKIPLKNGRTIGFPVLRVLNKAERKELLEEIEEFSINKGKFLEKSPKTSNLKDSLKKILSKKELEKLISGFDSVGNICVIEIPKELEKKEKQIGNALLESNKNFETVCKITGSHSGKFRVQPVKVIAGKSNKTAIYRESNCVFKVSIDKVFFSPRLSFERLRIAKLIKKGEIVGAFFAGVGPFPVVFAKNSQMEKAFAIELNPFAAKQLQENIELNKVQDKVEGIFGDVKKVVPKMLVGKCDRVVMPLPHSGENFLEEALIALKEKGGIVHFYQIVDSKKPYDKPLEEINAVAKKLGKKIRVLNKREARGFSASKIQVVIDFEVKPKR